MWPEAEVIGSLCGNHGMLGITCEKLVSASMQACHIVCLCERMGMIAMILNTWEAHGNQGFLAKRLHHSTCIIEVFATRSNCWLCEISDKVYIIHINTYPIINVSEMWVYIIAPNTHVIAAIREDPTFHLSFSHSLCISIAAPPVWCHMCLCAKF